MLRLSKMVLALALLAAVGIMAAPPAHAAVTEYYDRASFLAAVAGYKINVDWDDTGLPTEPEVGYGTSAGVTRLGVNVVGNTDWNNGNGWGYYLYSGLYSGPGWELYQWNSSRVLLSLGQSGGGGIGNLTVTLPSGVRAAGSDLMLYPHASDNPLGQMVANVKLVGESYGGFTTTTLPARPERGFFGVISTDKDIEAMKFNLNYNGYGYYILMDNFVYQPLVGDLTGSIEIGGYSGDLSISPVKVEFVPTSGGAAYAQELTLAANPDTYTISVCAGTYDVYFSSCKSLRRLVSGVVITGGAPTAAPSIVLKNGDLDGDNSVTTTDVSNVLTNLDQTGN